MRQLYDFDNAAIFVKAFPADFGYWKRSRESMPAFSLLHRTRKSRFYSAFFELSQNLFLF
ncbi:hypothetical protein D1AOALGA4SA_5368 [Olavius algarvensis Delta 1 endosymbiont]|nr:hypothetical protein D1AOALGA4SA_5368 [Olavius algarvensis Delta 1 endosymbiont]